MQCVILQARSVSVGVRFNCPEFLRFLGIGTKFSSRWGQLISKLALRAAKSVCVELPNGKKDIDVKKFVKIEKIPGGEIEESSEK